MMSATKCRICGDYMYDRMGIHCCGPSYLVVILGSNNVPTTPFEIWEQLRVVRQFSDRGPSDAVENAVRDYHNLAAEYSSNTVAGAMPWGDWRLWEIAHEEDDWALLDPALLTWYDVTMRMEPSYVADQISRPSAVGGG